MFKLIRVYADGRVRTIHAKLNAEDAAGWQELIDSLPKHDKWRDVIEKI